MSIRSVVACFAHPDDETVLAGGIMAMLAQQGVAVHVVCATRGEGGETGEPIVSVSREKLAATREAELYSAVRAIGTTVEIMGYIDPLIGEDEAMYAFEADYQTLAAQFATIARRRRADVVLTHGSDGEYGHPAHKLVHRAVLDGIRNLYPSTLVYTVAANVPSVEDRLWNKNEPAHLALDIRPWSVAKIAAMEAHRTQHALFMRRRKLTRVADALRTIESVRRAYPNTHGEPPDDAFATLLRTAGAWTPT